MTRNKNKLKLKPLKINREYMQEFYEREKWLSKQKDNFPGEIMAYMKKNGEWTIIAHAKDENSLLKKIAKLLENNEISEEDIVLFR
ncbi:MAG: hypothetical protein ACTSRH_09420 [Promethearchaeota archaeon]